MRQSVCVVGQQRETLQKVKHKVASLLDVPFPIESLHVKSASDIKDDALLVPKVILVAVHSPGRKLLDEEGDHGQLDLLYDAAIDMGGELVVVVYLWEIAVTSRKLICTRVAYTDDDIL